MKNLKSNENGMAEILGTARVLPDADIGEMGRYLLLRFCCRSLSLSTIPGNHVAE